MIEYRFFVHLLGQGANFILGELADVIAEQDFVFGERGEGRGIRDLQSFRHENTSIKARTPRLLGNSKL